MRKVKLEQATQAELLDHCRNVLGMLKATVPDTMGAGALKEKILALNPEVDEIVVTDAAGPGAPAAAAQSFAPGHGGNPAAAEKATGTPTAMNGAFDPKVMVNIFKDDQNKGEPIQVAVNGRTMLIPVGQNVPIPLRYFLALKAAITTVYDFNAATNENVPRDEFRHRFNSVLPPREEIVAWDKAMGGDGVRIMEVLMAA